MLEQKKYHQPIHNIMRVWLKMLLHIQTQYCSFIMFLSN